MINVSTKVCVVGGKLQGLEALYLAEKAGMETTLIDKKKNPLGKNFCGRFICQDVVQYTTELICALEDADFVVPALEDKEALATLVLLASKYDINLVFDASAYEITASKIASDERMRQRGLPAPQYFPEGDFPYIVKPSAMSCSEGVDKILDKKALDAFFQAHQEEDWVVEEFLDGPSYSLEVIGTPGNYQTYHVTELFMDKGYDCKRVSSCPDFPEALQKQFEEETVALAEMVQLHGIMDVEVIEVNGILKILEIDARIPSQTPITVYHATGWNFMAELARKFGKNGFVSHVPRHKPAHVVLEQIAVNGNEVAVLGEHILHDATELHHFYSFCGAAEAITDFVPGKNSWVATLIFTGRNRADLESNLKRFPKELSSLLGQAVCFRDEFPEA